MSSDPLKFFRLARELNVEYKEYLKSHPAHFRASLSSIALISLRHDTPQLGFNCSYSKLEKAAINIDEYLDKLTSMSLPLRLTPEKQMQSWIISYSMNNDSLPFDSDITFVTDEFARKGVSSKLVADIFSFIQKTNTFVIIELKSNRALTELSNQLDNCEDLVKADTHFYAELLQAHGFAWEEPFRIQKIAVWPCSRIAQPKKFKSDIREICYQKAGGSFIFQEIL